MIETERRGSVRYKRRAAAKFLCVRTQLRVYSATYGCTRREWHCVVRFNTRRSSLPPCSDRSRRNAPSALVADGGDMTRLFQRGEFYRLCAFIAKLTQPSEEFRATDAFIQKRLLEYRPIANQNSRLAANEMTDHRRPRT